jgi:hypothetical protein
MGGPMHIKNKGLLLPATILTIFFGYIGYTQLFVDNTAIAQKTIESTIAALPATQTTTTQSSAYYGLKRAQIALQEYNKNVVESTRGCNCGPEIDKYTQNTPAQWCADFASWVTNEAGSPVLNPDTGSWRIPNSRAFSEQLQKSGTFYTRDQIKEQNIQPQIGDFVIYWRGDADNNLGHMDIVVATSNTPGKAELVGGNVKDRVAYRGDFSYLDYSGFLGFGRPEKN